MNHFEPQSRMYAVYLFSLRLYLIIYFKSPLRKSCPLLEGGLQINLKNCIRTKSKGLNIVNKSLKYAAERETCMKCLHYHE